MSGARASRPDPLPELERRLDGLEEKFAVFQRSIAERLSQSLRLLLQNEDAHDAQLRATLNGLERQMAEIRQRLDALIGPVTLH